MNNIKDLKPHNIWNIFDEITKVPRPSKREEKIINFLKNFADKYSLEYRQDKTGNVVIISHASKGYQEAPTIILQSHVDMVCEKDEDVKFDFDNDPIQTYIDNGWIKAKGTTLGADCGIGMAASLALLIDKEVEHPKIEALFTVDEETGLTGAFGLSDDLIDGKLLLNLDSEEEGEFCIGCAGGIDTVATYKFTTKKRLKGHKAYIIKVSGLNGGHSGEDINKLLANANIILGRFLFEQFHNFGLNLIDISGGNLRNAIPREAKAIVTIPASLSSYFQKYFEKYSTTVKNEYHKSEPEMSLTLAEYNDDYENIIDRETFLGVITAIYTAPNGVQAFSQDVDGLVETSSNLASVKVDIENNSIIIATSQRSSLESKKYYISNIMKEIFEGTGANVEQSDGYPGWAPNTNSELLKRSISCYETLFGCKPKVKAIHAGLECGLFLEKYPYLDMISFGPTILRPHSPQEMLNIESVNKFWQLLCKIVSEK